MDGLSRVCEKCWRKSLKDSEHASYQMRTFRLQGYFVWLRRISKICRILSMSQKVTQLFKKLDKPEFSQGLEGRILCFIASRMEKRHKRAIIFSRAGLCVSFLIFLGAVAAYGQAIVNSEFWSIGSLFFSDWYSVLQNWQAYGYSLLETLPIFALAAIIVPVFLMLAAADANIIINAKKPKYI